MLQVLTCLILDLPCPCRVEGHVPKKQKHIKKCEYCNNVTCEKGHCFRTCKNCTGRIKNVYAHDNHRCIVHDNSVAETLLETGVNSGKEKKYKLWAYDLESCREFQTNKFVTKFKRDGHGFNRNLEVIVERKSFQKPNLVVFQNVFDPAEKHIYFGDTCIDQFLQFMIEHNKGFNICVAHNGSGYDTQLISEYAAHFKQKISSINSGLKFTELRVGKVIFRDSMLHLQGSLASLAKNYNLPMLKGYFPHLFNVRENYEYNGVLPAKSFFDLTFSVKNRQDLQVFDDWYAEREQTPWCFKQELIKYCENDVEILAKIMKLFHDVCINRFERTPWVHCTAPSFCHKTIVCQITKSLNLPADPDELSATIHQLSKETWAALVPQEYWFARQALIGGRTDVKRVHYRLTDEDVAAGRRIVYQDIVSMYPYVQAQTKFLYPVGTPKIMVFDARYLPCREHQSGDKNNAWVNCTCPAKDRWADPLISLHKHLNEQPSAQDLLDNQNDLFGIWCVTLVPPKNLFHPVLCVYDYKKMKRVATLETIKEGVFTSVEIVKALELGYKLVKVHRMDIYKAREGLWTDFIKKLYIDKMANSEPTPSLEEQERLVAAYEERFGMGDEVRQSFPSWEYRAAARLTFKIMLNSGWGKHCTRPNLPNYTYIEEDDDEEMNKLYMGLAEGELNMMKICSQGPRVVVKTQALNRERTSHNLYLPAGLFVPAYGRLMLYDALEKLGKRVLYHDTDSVIYIHDPQQENLVVDDIWGSWDEEKVSKNGNILAFVGLGPKSYAIKTRDGKDIIKLKGVALKHAHERQVCFDTLEKMLLEKSQIRVPQMTMPYKMGIGKSIEEFLKVIKFDPDELKGFMHTDMCMYPPGYCQGCLGLGEHVCDV